MQRNMQSYAFSDNRPVFISPGLWLGGRGAEANIDALLGCGISHILTVGVELVPSHRSRFAYLRVPIFDLPGEDLLRYFPLCFAFIEEGLRQGGVLVHCMAGVSRSASVVIGWLMFERGLQFREARHHVAQARPRIKPNSGFEQQLLAFQDVGCKLAEH